MKCVHSQGTIVSSLSAPDLAIMEECKEEAEVNPPTEATAANLGHPGTPAQEAESRSKGDYAKEQTLVDTQQPGHDAELTSTLAGNSLPSMQNLSLDPKRCLCNHASPNLEKACVAAQ